MLYLRAEKVESIFWLAVDVVGALALFSAGILGLATWRAEGAPRNGTLYWALAGFGLVYLAIDERLSLHERAGRWLNDTGFTAPAGVNHTDDLILAVMGLAGLLMTLSCWREIAARREVAFPLFGALGLFAIAIAIDMLGPVDGWAPRIEEGIELVACLLTLVALGRRFALSPSGGLAPAWPWLRRMLPPAPAPSAIEQERLQ